jgi:hypothetical protein
MVFAAGIPLNVWQGRGGMKKAVAGDVRGVIESLFSRLLASCSELPTA